MKPKKKKSTPRQKMDTVGASDFYMLFPSDRTDAAYEKLCAAMSAAVATKEEKDQRIMRADEFNELLRRCAEAIERIADKLWEDA